MTVGHGHLFVTLFGARIILLHFPLIFIFPTVFDKNDLVRFAEVTLLIAIPMTILIGFQYYLPQSHFVNVGIGGEGSSGFGGALGRFRSSGTFTFTNAVSMYYAIAASLMAGYLTGVFGRNPKWLWISLGCLLLAVPLCISRTLAFSYALVSLAVLISGVLSPRFLGRIIPAIIVICLVLVPITQMPVFEDSTEAFIERWENATESEGGEKGVRGVLESRVLNDLTGPFERLERIPLFGYGIGIGTQTGTFLFFRRRGYLLGEGEWFRVTGELGIILSFFYLGLRLWLAGLLLIKSILQSKSGHPLPLILSPMPAFWLILGNSGQPTSLGFIVTFTGLWALSLKTCKEDMQESSS
ncbi:MAG: hypothetical protein AB3N63_12995 [Puniceicoccaceae bacterium]